MNNTTQTFAYQILYSADQGATWQTWSGALVSAVTAATNSVAISSLTAGGSYLFKVTPISYVGLGASSTVTSGPLNGVSSLAATPGNASISVTWQAPSSLGTATLNGYVVAYCAIGVGSNCLSGGTGTFTVVAPGSLATPTASTTATSLTITGLTNGTTYVVQVTPLVNSLVGTGGSVTVTPSATAGPLVQFLIAQGGAASTTLSWLAPAQVTGTTVTGYRVQYSTDGATWTTFPNPNTNP